MNMKFRTEIYLFKLIIYYIKDAILLIYDGFIILGY